MCRNMGRMKAIVLPEPVLATPMMSRPDMMDGIACAWMEVGAAYSRPLITSMLCKRSGLASVDKEERAGGTHQAAGKPK